MFRRVLIGLGLILLLPSIGCAKLPDTAARSQVVATSTEAPIPPTETSVPPTATREPSRTPTVPRPTFTAAPTRTATATPTSTPVRDGSVSDESATAPAKLYTAPGGAWSLRYPDTLLHKEDVGKDITIFISEDRGVFGAVDVFRSAAANRGDPNAALRDRARSALQQMYNKDVTITDSLDDLSPPWQAGLLFITDLGSKGEAVYFQVDRGASGQTLIGFIMGYKAAREDEVRPLLDAMQRSFRTPQSSTVRAIEPTRTATARPRTATPVATATKVATGLVSADAWRRGWASLSEAERRYLDSFITNYEDSVSVAVRLNRILRELETQPSLLQDSDWRLRATAAVFQFALLKSIMEDETPPPLFKDVHVTYLRALEQYTLAAAAFIAGLDNLEPKLFLTAQGYILSGNQENDKLPALIEKAREQRRLGR